MKRPLAVAILAAGKGKRMKSKLPKVLFDLCGKPALFYPVHAAEPLGPSRFVVVIGWGAEQIRKAFEGSQLDFVLQEALLGTGHALQQTQEKLKDFEGDLLVLYGDGPLVKTETLQRIVDIHRSENHSATVMTALADDPTGYGRIVRDGQGRFTKIVEEKDADPATRKIREINTGITVYRCPELFEYLSMLKDDNQQNEYYLTDLPQIIADRGLSVGLVLHDDPTELEGFNSIMQYADLRKRLQQRILASHMEQGVTIVDPETTYIDFGVEIGEGTRILPFTVIQKDVTIGEGCSVGPFAFLKQGAMLDKESSLGGFVELEDVFCLNGASAENHGSKEGEKP
ncbi:MAG: NTP transferase domain-containing protein [Planctomycetes bacterium]|nr:NTP transferase domain-containing protein [Planctomycetota bacterium]